MTYDNNSWMDQGNDSDNNNGGNSPTPKDLRTQLEKVLEDNKTLKSELAQLRIEKRRTDVSKVVADKGYSAKVASFYPSDGEATEPAVEKWLNENSDVFAVHRTDSDDANNDNDDDGNTSDEPVTDIPQTVQEVWQLLQQEGVVPPAGSQALLNQVLNAQSDEELMELLEQKA